MSLVSFVSLFCYRTFDLGIMRRDRILAKIAVSMKCEIPCLDEADGLRCNEIVFGYVLKRVVRIHWSVARREKADLYEVVILSGYRSSRPLDIEQLLCRSSPCASSAGKTEQAERDRGGVGVSVRWRHGQMEGT
nr:hypothetical protein CFP56_20509 [Quercus suber]